MSADRLSALDVAFLCLEGHTTPMHMGAVALFRAPGAVAGDRLVALLAERAAQVPELRRRVRPEWSPFGGALWESDPGFDPVRHLGVRDLGGHRDGGELARLASTWIAAPLDLDAPLWNAEVVTGLPGGEFALLLKLHHALTDGAGAVDVASRLLDDAPARRTPRPVPYRPTVPPLNRVFRLAHTALHGAAESTRIAGAMVRAARPYPASPTLTRNCASRRIGFVRAPLTDIRRIRSAHGGTTNDVLLAVVAGALRDWQVNQGRQHASRALRALVPVSLRGRQADEPPGNALSGYLCDLPSDVDDPVARLHAVRAVMERNKANGPVRGPGAVPVLAGRLPSGVHRMATRLVGQAAPLLFDTVVTNVPLPGRTLSFGGAELREVYPLVPLPARQAVGVAAATYRDSLHIGLQVNGAAAPDVGSLADAVTKSFEALRQRCG